MDLTSGKSSPSISEADLLPGLQAGDALTFEAFVRRFCDPMYYVARRILRNDEDTREVIQEAFLAVFRKVGDFDKRSTLQTWLHRIVINTSLRRLQQNRRGPEQSMEALLPQFADDEHHRLQPLEPTCSVEELVSRAELRTLVHAKIDLLPDQYRTVLLIRDIEGLSTEEAAEMLQTTPGVIKMRLHRARQALRQLLEPLLRGEQP